MIVIDEYFLSIIYMHNLLFFFQTQTIKKPSNYKIKYKNNYTHTNMDLVSILGLVVFLLFLFLNIYKICDTN